MNLIGLTGTIASGKSTVAKLLGAYPKTHVIYTDRLARDVVMPGSEALSQILTMFGSEYALPDGTLDRKRLGDLVFNNVKARKIVEELTHSKILSQLFDEINSLQDKHFVIIENAVLFESGQHHMLDGFIIVSVNKPIQKERLMKRNSLTSDEADARIAAQNSLAWKINAAEKTGKPIILIENSLDTTETLVRIVDEVHQALVKVYNLT